MNQTKKQVYSWKNPPPPQPSLSQYPSITAPEQNLTIRQIMDRYSRGMPLTSQIKQPQYHNGEFPDIAGLDLTEVQALRKAADKNVNDIKKNLQEQETAQYNAKQKALHDKIQELQQQINASGNQARGKVEADRPNPIS